MSVTYPELGTDIAASEEAMSVESVKTATDVISPMSGEIVAINEALEDEPELINDEPYDGGWLFKILPHDLSELDELLSDDDYQNLIDNE